MSNYQIKISPSILAADFTRLGQDVQEAQASGADRIHIDVMDGRFVPNITMGSLVVEAVRRVTDLPLDVHLMIIHPSEHIEDFIRAGATRVTVHIEADHNLHRTIHHIKSLGAEAGVALNPHTPADVLSVILGDVDNVTVMTVNPGFGGQKFIHGMLPKIRQIRQMGQAIGHDVDIEIDGGVNDQTAIQVVEAGANLLVAGSAVFGHPHGIKGGMDAIRGSLLNK
jgi:ribulose-phosphate 3-epimerase